MRSFWVLLLERSQIAGPCHGEFALACFHEKGKGRGEAGLRDLEEATVIRIRHGLYSKEND